MLREIFWQVAPQMAIEIRHDYRAVIKMLSHNSARELLALLVINHRGAPAVNALEILDHINEINELQDIPRIVWSNRTDKYFRHLCLQKGASDHFIIPEKPSELKSVAKKSLQSIAGGEEKRP